MRLKKIFSVILILSLSFVLTACTSPSPSSNIDLNLALPTSGQTPTPVSTISANQLVAINTSKGQILVKLNHNQAPNATANFLRKSESGFYENLIFHRVEPGFVIQGGDPLGTGQGGATIKSELNNIPFVRGSVGLARTPETPDISNDSQFFICLSTPACSGLTNQYVNFAQVVYGLDVADQIVQGDKILNITSQTK